jgi:hypothetical protein
MIQDTQDTFSTLCFFAPIEKSAAQANGNVVVDGPLSNPEADLEGETTESDGLWKGLETFFELGAPVDWDHNYARYGTAKWLIGKGLTRHMAPHPRTGLPVPWLKAELFGWNEVAKEAIERLKNGEGLGYSIYGGVRKREGDHIVEPIVTMVAVTPIPVVAANAGCVTLAKGGLAANGAPLWTIPGRFDPNLGQLALAKAIQAAAAPAKAGPGITALGVEDFAGESKTPAGKKRTQQEQRDALRKAIAEWRADMLRRAVAAQGR